MESGTPNCSPLCFILVRFSFRNGANLRPKFNLENYVCLCFRIEKKKKANLLLPIKKRINTREKPFSLQHSGPSGGKKEGDRDYTALMNLI